MGYASRLRDLLLANDPAFSRLRLSVRVTTIIVLSILILLALDQWIAPIPFASYTLAFLLAAQGELAVHDNSPAGQMKTRVFAIVASIIATSVAALLESHRLISDAAFLLVIFLVAYGRAYGQRWFAVGMFAFMSYFVGAYYHPPFTDMPYVALGPIVAGICSYAVHGFILPDDWQRDLVTAMRSVLSRVDVILKYLAHLSHKKHIAAKDAQELHRCQARLTEAVLMAEGLVPTNGRDLLPGEGDPAADLIIHLFDLHMAAESVIVLSRHRLAGRPLMDALVKGDDEAVEREAKRIMTRGDDEAETAHAMLWARDARSTLTKALDEAEATRFAGFEEPAPPAPDLKLPTFSLHDPGLRNALQITLASGIAMVFGLMLSRQRWFWAVLTAFLVFTNTSSRGDTMVKAFQRTLGTLIGIVIGMMLAIIIGDHVVLIVGVAIVCIFLGYYFLRVSYATMSFFVTVVICLLYSFTDKLTLDILQLRLEETVIGAVAGIGVAFYVFPVRTEERLEKAVNKWFAILRDLLEAAVKNKPSSDLIALSIKLDKAYRDIAAASRPLGAFWQVVTRPGQIRKTLGLFMACTYWARIFAGKIAFSGTPMDDEIRRAVDQNLERVDTLTKKGCACFFAKRATAPSPSDNLLPLSRKDSRLGIDMIGMYLDRLYPLQE